MTNSVLNNDGKWWRLIWSQLRELPFLTPDLHLSGHICTGFYNSLTWCKHRCGWIKYYLCGGTLQRGAWALKTSRKKTHDCFCRLSHQWKQLATPAIRQQHSDIDQRQTATHLYMKTAASYRWTRKFNSWTALWRNAEDYLFSPQVWQDGTGHTLERFTWKTSWWRRLAAPVMNYLQHQQISPLSWEYSIHPELHHIIVTVWDLK